MPEEGQDDGNDAGLQEVLSAAHAPDTRRGPRHSALYEWLWTRHTSLAHALNPPRTPNWTAMAGRFAKLGIVDGKGQPPTPVLVRRTWLKVNRAKELVALGAVPPRRRGKTPVPVDGQPAGPSSQALPGPPTPTLLLPAFEPVEVEPEPKYQFRFAGGPKKWTNADPGPE